MNPKNAGKLKGARFAFAQGGNKGTRLVYLTPPVKITEHRGCIEACWAHPQRHEMPFRYADAPILVSNKAKSQFPRLEASIEVGGRASLEAQFASNFRSRTTCLDDELASELIRIYNQKRNKAQVAQIARLYDEALPLPLSAPDRERERTYRDKLDEARRPKPKNACRTAKRVRIGPPCPNDRRGKPR
jgi:hypothetical protein